MKRRWDLLVARLSPPGQDTSGRTGWILAANGFSALVGLTVFAARLEGYLRSCRRSWDWGENLPMPYFADVLGGSLGGFVLVGLLCLVLIPVHTAYFYQGSRSAYLMRRLPRRREFFIRTAGLPLLLFMITAVLAAACLLLFYLWYCGATPAEYLQPGQWRYLLTQWIGV